MERASGLGLATIREAPKVLLHDHLDGGLRPRTVIELAREIGYRELPTDEILRLAASAPPSRFEMNTAATADTHERTISAGHGVAAGQPLDG